MKKRRLVMSKTTAERTQPFKRVGMSIFSAEMGCGMTHYGVHHSPWASATGWNKKIQGAKKKSMACRQEKIRGSREQKGC